MTKTMVIMRPEKGASFEIGVKATFLMCWSPTTHTWGATVKGMCKDRWLLCVQQYVKGVAEKRS